MVRVLLFALLLLGAMEARAAGSALPRSTIEVLPSLAGEERGLVILFPGGGMSSKLFTDVPGRNIARIFQEKGMKVLLPGSPILELGDRCLHEECGFLSQWGVEAYRKAYFQAILPWVTSARTLGKPVLIGGWSLGTLWASLMIQEDPGAFDGLIFWEGLIHSSSPEVHRVNSKYKIQEKGFILDQTGMNETLGKMVSNGKLNFVEKFVINYLATQRVGLYTPSFAYAAGTAFRLKHSDTWVAANTYAQAIPYESKQIMVDYLRLLSSSEVSPAFSRLKDFRGKIIAFGGGLGFGAFMPDSLRLFESASEIDSHFESGFGHADHFGSREFEQVFADPLRNWINEF